jgi:hypothetical protein
MTDLPSNLIDALRSNNVVLFLGAGASMGAKHPAGNAIPSGSQLRDMISDRFLDGHLKDRSLAEVAEYAVSETDLLTVQTYIRDIFVPFRPADYHKIIPLFPWRAILTTNLDLILEKAYDAVGARVQNIVPILKNSQKFDQSLRATANPLEFIKLHGSCDHFQDLEIPFILATEQYAKFSDHRTRLFDRLKDIAAEYNLVFCGYSILDPHIQTILHSMFSLGAIRPAYFIVKPHFDEVETRYWNGKRVTPIPVGFGNFLEALRSKIDPALVTAGVRAIGVGDPIRRFYGRTSISETPDLRSFLSRDVTHIHAGMAAATQSAADFYRGFDTGLYPIMADMDVRRNVTDTILATIFLRTDDKKDGPDFYLLKSAAGTGKTIVLKRLAWEAATEFDCLVLLHKPNGSLRVSALEELYSYAGRRIFLIVDRAAYYVDEISRLLDECKIKGLPITVITSERENEWAVRCEKLDQKLDGTFEIHRFAHNEIVELVDKLSRFKALGRLEEFAPENRINEFEIRAERQILVMLYELTQGIPFEELIADEYDRIIPTEAQLLYLDVCALNRLNVPVRAGLISRVSDIHFSEFKSRFLDPLRQIVIAERDEYIGDMMYSARHATIAQIVFEHVLNDQERRFDTLVRIIKGMNLSYSSDEIAFKAMIAGREIAQLFPSQELGRRFFDIAIEVAGPDASVIQQRAIFEINHAGGSPELGLTWIEKAERLRPYDRAIRHTKGNILRACAAAAKNPLKRDELRKAAHQTLAPLAHSDARQPHGFHTLALVLLDDIREYLVEKGASKDEEDRALIGKLEELQKVIRTGLSIFPEEARLLAVESEYYKIIQNHRRALQSLSKAFQRNKRLDWIAVRLANVHRLAGDREQSATILREAIEANPSSKEANFALGRLMADSSDQGERRTAVKYFRRAFTKGDSNFTAQLWYARELFLTGRYDEADIIFTELAQVHIAAEVKRTIIGIVRNDDGSPRLFKGTVVTREEGFVFVSFPDLPKNIFIFRGEVRARDWNQIRIGSGIEGKIGFTYRGPCGSDVHLA